MYTPLIVTASAIAIAAVTYGVGTPIVLSELARQDILLTTLDEGRGKVIVANGALYDIIMSSEGFHLNRPGRPGYDKSKPNWECLPNEEGVEYDERSQLYKKHGMYWVGWPWQHQILSYRFEWSELHSKKGGGMEIVTRDEQTSVFMANDFPYVMVTSEDLRTKDNLPVALECVVTVWINNPAKALFRTNDWRSQVQALVDRESKNFVGDFNYEQIRSETDGDGGDISENFSERLTALSEKDPGRRDGLGTAIAYGVTIRSVSMRKVALVGPNAAEFERASTAKYTADALATAKKTAADATAYETEVTKTAEAKGIELVGAAQAAADKARLEPITENLDAARILYSSQALQSPGDGKVIVVGSDILGSAAQALGSLGQKLTDTKKKDTVA